MIIVKSDILVYLKKPISTKFFGQNKTYRGFVVMPILTILPFLAFQYLGFYNLDWFPIRNQPIFIGTTLGLAYVLAELPNSFMKRKLKIAPGKLPESNKVIFAIIDQADSVVGCLIVYYLIEKIDLVLLCAALFIGTAIHLLLNYTLFKLGVRKNPL